MQIVNGYVCECGDEVRLAKRGVDPANPHSDPVKQKELDIKRGVEDPAILGETKAGDFDPNRRSSEAVVFGGSLAGESRSVASAAALRLVDLLA